MGKEIAILPVDLSNEIVVLRTSPRNLDPYDEILSTILEPEDDNVLDAAAEALNEFGYVAREYHLVYFQAFAEKFGGPDYTVIAKDCQEVAQASSSRDGTLSIAYTLTIDDFIKMIQRKEFRRIPVLMSKLLQHGNEMELRRHFENPEKFANASQMYADGL